MPGKRERRGGGHSEEGEEGRGTEEK